MKKILILVSIICFCVCFIFFSGVVSYADTTTVSTSSVSALSTTTTKNTTIGSSSINVVVSQDNMFTGLKTLIDFYASDIDKTQKELLYKELVFLVTDCNINEGYTLETFKTAFIEVLQKYNIEITSDIEDAIIQYTVYYLSNCFKDDETDYLVWIGGSVGIMITLFLTSQQGGVHRA